MLPVKRTVKKKKVLAIRNYGLRFLWLFIAYYKFTWNKTSVLNAENGHLRRKSGGAQCIKLPYQTLKTGI